MRGGERHPSRHPSISQDPGACSDTASFKNSEQIGLATAELQGGGGV